MVTRLSACLLLPLARVTWGAPCDIYAEHGTPCAAAHSMVRALFSAYDGGLYQLKRFNDNATLDIAPMTAGGVADAASHDAFCAAAASTSSAATAAAAPSYPPRADCVVYQIYDQTGHGNHMLPATPAINNPNYDNPVNATRHSIAVGGGHKAYGAYFESGMGYRAQNTSRVARGNEPETIYMVTSGTHLNTGCCFDYGNSENDCTNHSAYCNGCMEAVYFGTGYGGGGKGPWIGMDMENGIYGGKYVNDSFLRSDFVTAMVKGGTNSFATKGADATAGELKLMSSGPRPGGYQPMHKTGAIILGVGGDNADRRGGVGIPGTSIGTFYEGLLTVGYTSDAADAAVQADIVAARYGQ